MKINPYKLGMNFYIILIVSVVVFIGCKTFEKHEDERRFKKDVESFFQTPDLSKIK
jgi:hypothetical protein